MTEAGFSEAGTSSIPPEFFFKKQTKLNEIQKNKPIYEAKDPTAEKTVFKTFYSL